MKLWFCCAITASGLTIAQTAEEAKNKFAKTLEEDGIWYNNSIETIEINEIEGYKVILQQINEL